MNTRRNALLLAAAFVSAPAFAASGNSPAIFNFGGSGSSSTHSSGLLGLGNGSGGRLFTRDTSRSNFSGSGSGSARRTFTFRDSSGNRSSVSRTFNFNRDDSSGSLPGLAALTNSSDSSNNNNRAVRVLRVQRSGNQSSSQFFRSDGNGSGIFGTRTVRITYGHDSNSAEGGLNLPGLTLNGSADSNR